MRLGGQGAFLHPQRPPQKAPACAGCLWPPRAHLRSWVRLAWQGALLHLRRPSAKAPACPGRPWPARAHVGGLSSLEGWAHGAVALAVEGPWLHRRMTRATVRCVAQAVQVAGWPLTQAAMGP